MSSILILRPSSLGSVVESIGISVDARSSNMERTSARVESGLASRGPEVRG